MAVHKADCVYKQIFGSASDLFSSFFAFVLHVYCVYGSSLARSWSADMTRPRILVWTQDHEISRENYRPMIR